MDLTLTQSNKSLIHQTAESMKKLKKLSTRMRMFQVMAFSLISLTAFSQSEKGTLLLNEFSNGPDGSKEWAELIVANNNTQGTDIYVDITGWLFDDNNGIFNGTTVSGAGISPGHLRFGSTDGFWENVEVGTYIVLFNGKDTSRFDQNNQAFVNAFNDANGVYAVNNGSDSIFVFVAVGISPYIEYKGNTPIVGTNNKRFYCSQDAYTLDSNAWNAVGLRNGDSILGDGFQVRCPGCIDVPAYSDEPGFYHGVSYSAQNSHVIMDSTVGVEGPHIVVDSLGGTGRAFEFFQGTGLNDIAADANWRAISYANATPGLVNSNDNQDYRDSVTNLLHTYPICYEFEPEPTSGTASLIVTEFSNGPSGGCEYVEILVASCIGDLFATEVDIRGWVIDDNNGVFGSGSGKGITSGHLKFASVDELSSVPVGTVIVMYYGNDNCYNFVNDEDPSDSTMVLQIDGTNPTTLVVSNRSATGISVKPTTTDSTYCPAAYETEAVDWNGKVAFGNTADGVQVRCPECEPTFYHGACYGTALSARAQTSTDLGGPKIASGSQGGKTLILVTGGCDVGNDANWTIVNAPAAGTPPATAGVVDTAVYNPIITRRECFFPCCPGPMMEKAGQKTGIRNLEESGFLVGEAYPNPTSNEVNIEIRSEEAFTLTFVDITGKVVYSHAYEATNGRQTITVDLSGMVSGTYFFNVVSNTDTYTGSVVINR